MFRYLELVLIRWYSEVFELRKNHNFATDMKQHTTPGGHITHKPQRNHDEFQEPTGTEPGVRES